MTAVAKDDPLAKLRADIAASRDPRDKLREDVRAQKDPVENLRQDVQAWKAPRQDVFAPGEYGYADKPPMMQNIGPSQTRQQYEELDKPGPRQMGIGEALKRKDYAELIPGVKPMRDIAVLDAMKELSRPQERLKRIADIDRELLELRGALKRPGAEEAGIQDRVADLQGQRQAETAYTTFNTREELLAKVTEHFEKIGAEQAEFPGGRTLPAQIVEGAIDMVPWMAEFYATGGAAKLGSDVARRGFIRLLGAHALRPGFRQLIKGISFVAGGAGRAALLQHRIAEANLRASLSEWRFTPRGQLVHKQLVKGPWKSFLRSYGATFVEALTEQMGEHLVGVMGKGVARIPGGKKLLQKLSKVPYGRTANVPRMLRRAGFQGWLGEMTEEEAAKFLHSVLGTEDFGTAEEQEAYASNDVMGYLMRAWVRLRGAYADPEQFVVQAGILGLPQAVSAGISRLKRGPAPGTTKELRQRLGGPGEPTAPIISPLKAPQAEAPTSEERARRKPTEVAKRDIKAAPEQPAVPEPAPAAPAEKQPWEMNEAERTTEIARLREQHKESLAAPLMSEGAMSPTQVNRMGKRERLQWRRRAQERMVVEAQIRNLQNPEAAEERFDGLKKKEAIARIQAQRQRIQDLERLGVGKTGKLRPTYRRAIAEAQRTIAEAAAPFPEVLADYPELKPRKTDSPAGDVGRPRRCWFRGESRCRLEDAYGRSTE
jgi:hypothetical protein